LDSAQDEIFNPFKSLKITALIYFFKNEGNGKIVTMLAAGWYPVGRVLVQASNCILLSQ
jgi:hypothetical protein